MHNRYSLLSKPHLENLHHCPPRIATLAFAQSSRQGLIINSRTSNWSVADAIEWKKSLENEIYQEAFTPIWGGDCTSTSSQATTGSYSVYKHLPARQIFLIAYNLHFVVWALSWGCKMGRNGVEVQMLSECVRSVSASLKLTKFYSSFSIVITQRRILMT